MDPVGRRRVDGDAAGVARAAPRAAGRRHAGSTAAAGPRPRPSHAVSRLERYLECPFKYFAATS